MSLTLSNVTVLAKLAQLELTDAQAEKSLVKLNEIFALVEQMQAVDTTGVEPLSHPIFALDSALPDDLALRLRDDVVTETNHRDEYQKPAPATRDGLYLVPKVLD
ncbi:Aspartyl-tRNA(Asn) amidotransferase subunit C [Oxalobacteraceae bacterium IMCC9480]|jgi:aspartyl-tRNA(Asn)/glutamyl-tRNA(Gln) amidotransferase subunit C|nr:Aspartyl-tRNA(Asn) amidotransferase subunit C [Oxalobacteraceae bacterium IMCC9480]